MAAEPVSAIVSLVQVSLAIIRKTAQFIEEAKEIDSVIKRLRNTLCDLEAVIILVDTTCRQAAPRKEDHSHFVEQTLKRCRNRLKKVQKLVKALAEKQSKTFIQKVGLKIKSDRSKGEIGEAIQDIRSLIDQINTGLSCWSLRLNSVIERRTSECLPVQSKFVPALQQISEDESTSPLTRSWSEAPTAFDIDVPVLSRSSSSATEYSKNSMSPLSSQRPGPYERNDSATSVSQPAKRSNDWVEFSSQVAKLRGNETQIHAIKKALGQYPQSRTLVNSKDSTQRSPLHLAAQRGDVELAQVLLQFSADIDAKDSYVWSVLDIAVHHKQDEFVSFLLNNDVNTTAILDQNRERFEEIQDELELRSSNKSRRRGLLRDWHEAESRPEDQ